MPISLRAWDVLGRVRRQDGSPYVFTGQGSDPVSDTSMRNLLRALGIGKEAGTLHGFRSSFRTWAAETGVADDIAEACLAHTIPDAVMRAYKRTTFIQMRTTVMLKWGLHLS